MRLQFSKLLARVVLALGLVLGFLAAQPAMAQTGDQQTGKVDWGIWVDGDGCMHWYADGGLEGYMVPRRNPETGRPVCLKRHACLAQSSDALFGPGGETLTKEGEADLAAFFAEQDAQAFAIYAHGDGSGGKAASERLTQAQAAAVAAAAKAAGAQVSSAIGGGARYPKVGNSTAAGKAKNRRIEIVCYR
jgi:outer membrane protein OmpA-like peptidoglycan-associated protein